MLDERDILALLQLGGHERETLFAQARQLRTAVFGDRVVVRAVCEVTNLCRVDCEFYPMRRSNDFTAPLPTAADNEFAWFGDVHQRAARNGARHDTPVLLAPSGRADPRGVPLGPGLAGAHQECLGQLAYFLLELEEEPRVVPLEPMRAGIAPRNHLDVIAQPLQIYGGSLVVLRHDPYPSLG
jgi:hypothetical protein